MSIRFCPTCFRLTWSHQAETSKIIPSTSLWAKVIPKVAYFRWLSHRVMIEKHFLNQHMLLLLLAGYDRYSFGIGWYIGLTDKENDLSVLVSADTVFYIGSFTNTAQPYFARCKCYICSKDFNITISKAPKWISRLKNH